MLLIIRLIRIKHWIKNLFVFIPLLVSGNIFDAVLLYKSIIIFFVFCFTSSAVYIFNDLMDIEFDKLHPKKKNRPLANGTITISLVNFVAAFLLASSLLLLFLINFDGLFPILLYLIMNILYSLYLKNLPLFDIFSISLGFVLRVLAGLAVTSLSSSFWLISLTFTLSLLLATGKRRHELAFNEAILSRPSLSNYSLKFLESAQTMFANLVITFYVMYTFFNENFSGNHMILMYSSVFVLGGILRYLQVNFSQNSIEEPTDILYYDKFLLTIILLWALTIVLAYQL